MMALIPDSHIKTTPKLYVLEFDGAYVFVLQMEAELTQEATEDLSEQ